MGTDIRQDQQSLAGLVGDLFATEPLLVTIDGADSRFGLQQMLNAIGQIPDRQVDQIVALLSQHPTGGFVRPPNPFVGGEK